jgi:shikimate dehydrogenase
MDTTALTKDTTLCISLAGRPSNVGTRFHNHLYGQLGLDFVYKAFTTTDLPSAVAGIRGLGIRGCGVSMPYKQDVIALVDSMDDSARAISSVNTLVNTDGHLRAYNTDYLAIASLLRTYNVSTDLPFVVLGSGGMARAVVAALRDSGFGRGTVVARNETTGRPLAQEYGFSWLGSAGSQRPGLVINATPVGMAGGPDSDGLPIAPEVIDSAEVVFDVVAMPARTPMVQRAQARGATVITGAEVQSLQAAEQFVLYTGIRPSDEQVREAAVFSRATQASAE